MDNNLLTRYYQISAGNQPSIPKNGRGCLPSLSSENTCRKPLTHLNILKYFLNEKYKSKAAIFGNRKFCKPLTHLNILKYFLNEKYKSKAAIFGNRKFCSTYLFSYSLVVVISQVVVPQSDLSSTVIVSMCYNDLNTFLRLKACSTKRPYRTVIVG